MTILLVDPTILNNPILMICSFIVHLHLKNSLRSLGDWKNITNFGNDKIQ